MASIGSPRQHALSLRWELAGAECAAEVAALAATAFEPRYREAWSASQIASLLAGGGGWLEIARDEDGDLLAFALCRMAVDEVELLLCATHPAARRAGIGRQLMRRVRQSTRQRGCSRLFLEVRSSNAPALSLYLAEGFSISGRRPGYYVTTDAERLDALTLLVEVS